jgi:hypothetical protein
MWLVARARWVDAKARPRMTPGAAQRGLATQRSIWNELLSDRGFCVRFRRTVALDERVREIPMGGDELGPVQVERMTVAAVRAQRLASEDELGDAADEVLDSWALRIEARRSRLPQRSAHARSVIGRNQEIVKPRKKFSKSSLS